jgi:hypothetical protein
VDFDIFQVPNILALKNPELWEPGVRTPMLNVFSESTRGAGVLDCYYKPRHLLPADPVTLQITKWSSGLPGQDRGILRYRDATECEAAFREKLCLCNFSSEA